MKCFLNPKDFSIHNIGFTKSVESSEENENKKEIYKINYCTDVYHLNSLPIISKDCDCIATIEHLILDHFYEFYHPKKNKFYAVAGNIFQNLQNELSVTIFSKCTTSSSS